MTRSLIGSEKRADHASDFLSSWFEDMGCKGSVAARVCLGLWRLSPIIAGLHLKQMKDSQILSSFHELAAPIPPGVHLAGVDLSHMKDPEEIRAQLAPPLTQPLGVRFRDRILVLRPEDVDFRPDVEGTIAAANRYLEGPDFVDIALREAIGLPQQVRNVPLQFTVNEAKVRAWLEQQAQAWDYTPVHARARSN